MAGLITLENFKNMSQEAWDAMTPQQKRMALPWLKELCGIDTSKMLENSSTPGANGGQPGSCSTANNGRGNYTPWLNVPGCPVDCDPCAFPALDTDVRLFSWPEIDAQMWDTDTKINVLVSGTLPLTAGNSAVFIQEARRTVTWIPDCVQISTTWNGSPQPGLLTYQWATGPKNGPFPTGQVVFSNPQNGAQYEAGATPSTSLTTIKVPFPTYKGCNSMAIGALSSLRMIVALDTAATSTLQSILITAVHRKGGNGKKKGSCGCGCTDGSCAC